MLGLVAGLFVFSHAGDANEAFKQLPGAQDSDSFGRAQKVLKLTVGMACCLHAVAYMDSTPL